MTNTPEIPSEGLKLVRLFREQAGHNLDSFIILLGLAVKDGKISEEAALNYTHGERRAYDKLPTVTDPILGSSNF